MAGQPEVDFVEDERVGGEGLALSGRAAEGNTGFAGNASLTVSSKAFSSSNVWADAPSVLSMWRARGHSHAAQG